jgi:hypothetical protein
MNSGIMPNLTRSSGSTWRRARPGRGRCRTHRAVEADALVADARLDDLLEPGERPTADEQHVGGVDLDELLVRVLAPALGRHRRLGAFEDLQQRLLDALAGHVARDRRVLALAGDLVDLVDVDDAGLGTLDVEVGGLDQLEQDVLDVLADVARLGQRGGVGDGERHVELRARVCARCVLPQPVGPSSRMFDLASSTSSPTDRGGLVLVLDPLVVVVDRHREDLLGRSWPTT